MRETRNSLKTPIDVAGLPTQTTFTTSAPGPAAPVAVAGDLATRRSPGPAAPRSSSADLTATLARLAAINDGVVHRGFSTRASRALRKLNAREWNAVVGDLVDASPPELAVEAIANSARTAKPTSRFIDGKVIGAQASQKILDGTDAGDARTLRALRNRYFNKTDVLARLPPELHEEVVKSIRSDATGGDSAMDLMCFGFATRPVSPCEQARLIVEKLEGPSFDARLSRCLGMVLRLPLTDADTGRQAPAAFESSNTAASARSSESTYDDPSAHDQATTENMPRHEPTGVLRFDTLMAILERHGYSASRRKSLAKIEAAVRTVPAWARIPMAAAIMRADPPLPRVQQRVDPFEVQPKHRAFVCESLRTFSALSQQILIDLSSHQHTLDRLLETTAHASTALDPASKERIIRLSLEVPARSPLQATLREWADTGRVTGEAAARMRSDMATDIADSRGRVASAVSESVAQLKAFDTTLLRGELAKLVTLFNNANDDPRDRLKFRALGLTKLPPGQTSLEEVAALAAAFKSQAPLRFREPDSYHPLSAMMAAVGDSNAERVGDMALAEIERISDSASFARALNAHLRQTQDLASLLVRESQMRRVVDLAHELPVAGSNDESFADPIEVLLFAMEDGVTRLVNDRFGSRPGTHADLIEFDDAASDLSLDSNEPADPNDKAPLRDLRDTVLALRLKLMQQGLSNHGAP